MSEHNKHMQGDKESDFYFSSENRLLIYSLWPNWMRDVDNKNGITLVLSEEKQRELYRLLKEKYDQETTYTERMKLSEVDTLKAAVHDARLYMKHAGVDPNTTIMRRLNNLVEQYRKGKPE